MQVRRQVKEVNDGWTVVTQDKSLSQWEHMVAVTDDGFELLTLGQRELGIIQLFI